MKGYHPGRHCVNPAEEATWVNSELDGTIKILLDGNGPKSRTCELLQELSDFVKRELNIQDHKRQGIFENLGDYQFLNKISAP
jgi:pyruvate kinase